MFEIFMNESSFSGDGSQSCVVANPLNFSVNANQSVSQASRDGIRRLADREPTRADDAQVDLRVEQRRFEAVRGWNVAVSPGQTADEALEAQTPEVVGHLARCVGIDSEQRGNMIAKIRVAKASGKMSKHAQGVEQSHDAGVAEAQARGTLAAFHGGLLNSVESVLAEGTVLSDALSLKERSVDLLTDSAQMMQVFQSLADVEVARIVDGGLRTQGTVLLEVLLDVGTFVRDVQTGVDALRDDACAVTLPRSGCAAGHPLRKQEADAIGPAEVEVLPDYFFEEVSALHRLVEDMGEADLDLPEREFVLEARGAILRRQRPWQLLGPAVEEALHVLLPRTVADVLHRLGALARQEPVIAALKPHPFPTKLLLDPLMSVQTDLDGIRQVAADLQERRPPLGILDVEVVVVDGHGLARKLEVDSAARTEALTGLERRGFLLRDPDEDDPLGALEAGTVAGCDVVLALTALEMDDRNSAVVGERLDRPEEAVVQWAEQGGRRNGVAQVLAQEVAELPGGLECRHVAVDVEPVQARD